MAFCGANVCLTPTGRLEKRTSGLVSSLVWLTDRLVAKCEDFIASVWLFCHTAQKLCGLLSGLKNFHSLGVFKDHQATDGSPT
jgi:hypothetical protein